MNTKSLVFAVAAACIGMGTPAFAQNYERDYRSDQRYEHRGDRSQYRGGHDDSRYDRDDRYDRHDRWERRAQREHRREIRQEVRQYNEYHRSASPRYDIYRGRYLPNAYHGDRYVVRDYHRYNLGAPPRGTHWVRAGNDYLLVALATGIIAQVLLN